MFTKLIERVMFIEYRTHSCMIDYINEKIFKRLSIIVEWKYNSCIPCVKKMK